MRIRRGQVIAFGIAFSILSVSALGMGWAIAKWEVYLVKLPIYAPEGRTLRSITTETERWIRQGQDYIEPAENLETLGTENYLTRTYRRKDASEDDELPSRVRLHAAYYTGMIDTVPHVPERCLAGAGWVLRETWGEVEIPLESDSWVREKNLPEEIDGPVYTTLLSNRFSSREGGGRVRLPIGVTPEGGLRMRVSEFVSGGETWFAGYFFIANGGAVASSERVRLLAFDLTDDYAYYLKVQFNSNEVSSPEELAELAGALLDDLLGEIMLCVPDWVEVTRGTYPPEAERGGT